MERAATDERLRSLQRALAVLETEKKDAERQAVRLEKDKNALRNTLDKVECDISLVFKTLTEINSSSIIRLKRCVCLKLHGTQMRYGSF